MPGPGLALARALARAGRRLAAQARPDGRVRVRDPGPELEGWGEARLLPAALADRAGGPRCRHRQAVQHLLPWVTDPPAGILSGAELVRFILEDFRRHRGLRGAELDAQLDRALEALRLVAAQQRIQQRTSVTDTEGILVEATSSYLRRKQGSGEQVFIYRIRVENHSARTVKLIGRHWQIRNDCGDVVAEIPKGSPGVVGHTPVLGPGDCFQYSSGTTLPSSRGSMRGSFQMELVGREGTFDATVNAFALIAEEVPMYGV